MSDIKYLLTSLIAYRISKFIMDISSMNTTDILFISLIVKSNVAANRD